MMLKKQYFLKILSGTPLTPFGLAGLVTCIVLGPMDPKGPLSGTFDNISNMAAKSLVATHLPHSSNWPGTNFKKPYKKQRFLNMRCKKTP